MITVTRYHDFSCGHRVVGHEGKCKLLHGHNYRVHFTAVASVLDSVGRVVDFSVLKSTLCQWLEDNWDHRFLAWSEDPVLFHLGSASDHDDVNEVIGASIVFVPFNPTAERMAAYLLEVIGPNVLPGHVRLTEVMIEETRKCSAKATIWKS